MNDFKVSCWSDLDLETSLNPAVLLDVELIAPQFLEELSAIVDLLYKKLNHYNATNEPVHLSYIEQEYLALFSRYMVSKYYMMDLYSEQSVLSHSIEIKTELKIISMLYYLKVQKVI